MVGAHHVRFNDPWHTFTPTVAKVLAAYSPNIVPFRRSNSPYCVVVTVPLYLGEEIFCSVISERQELLSGG